MPYLQCTVNSCGNNADGYCCRPSIRVTGPHAHNSVDTSCESYIRKVEGASNCFGYNSPNQSLAVDCNACNCMYNYDRRCSALHISITNDAAGSQCSSFEK